MPKQASSTLALDMSLIPRQSSSEFIEKAPTQDIDEDGDEDVDNPDGGSSELVRRLLSPESGSLLTSLATEVAAQIMSAERSRDLASMSRQRFAVTQCVTLCVALLAVIGVLAFAFTHNADAVLQLLRSLNGTAPADL